MGAAVTLGQNCRPTRLRITAQAKPRHDWRKAEVKDDNTKPICDYHLWEQQVLIIAKLEISRNENAEANRQSGLGPS
jgi:hypothetical protein